MKNILYKIFPICLLTMGLTGCEEETKYRPAGNRAINDEHQ